jgi:hypothetical protein
MYVEDTDEEPKCLICGSMEECGHLVAVIDRSFLECRCGEFSDREHSFRSEIEEVFLDALKSKKSRKWSHEDIEQMWCQACEDYATEGEDFMLDGYAFYRFIVELLEDAGAIDHPGQVVDGGGPGMTSSVSLLYADRPNVVVDEALKNLKSMLNQHP